MAFCKHCGKEVGAAETFCRYCGARLSFSQTGQQGPFPGAAPNSEDLAVFIGKNSDAYLTKFRKFSEGGSDSFAATWHWPAFFFSFWWMLYRKLYPWAALVLFLGCVPYVGFLAMIAFGLSANYIYYLHAKKKLLEVKALHSSEVERAAAIARAGGVNNAVVVIAPLLIVAVIGIMAAIAVPQFVKYRQRAFDAMAKQEIQDACTRGVKIFSDQPEKMEIEPDDLLYAGLVRSPKVELMLLDGRRESFGLSARHLESKKVYITDRECRLTEEIQGSQEQRTL